MSSSMTIDVHIDETTEARARETLDATGLSMSDAVGILLRRVVAEQAFPLELKVPNAETRAALDEADRIIAERRERFADADELFEALDRPV